MAKPKEPVNPFYVLVVLLGVAFVVTAFAYGTMAYRAVAQTDDGSGLMALMDEHGVRIMAVEIVLLGIASFAAMWLDGVRMRRAEKNKEPLAAAGDLQESGR